MLTLLHLARLLCNVCMPRSACDTFCVLMTQDSSSDIDSALNVCDCLTLYVIPYTIFRVVQIVYMVDFA